MKYLNKLIYFVAKAWFGIVMVIAFTLTLILSIPFLIIEWINGPSSRVDVLVLKNKLIQLDKFPN